jgi:putative flippase GtrA
MLGRHQVASLAATAVDFLTMIGAVELLHIPPAIATGAGATFGAVTNFTLGRKYTFKGTHGAIGPQMIRYALVSGASALWNALGEYVFHDVLRVEYVVARLIVAVAVSFAWNFPMQRYFVFRAASASSQT